MIWDRLYRVRRQTVKKLLDCYSDVSCTFDHCVDQTDGFVVIIQKELETQAPSVEMIRAEAQQVQDGVGELCKRLGAMRDALNKAFSVILEPGTELTEKHFQRATGETIHKDHSPASTCRYLEPTYEQVVLQEDHVQQLRAIWSRWDEDMNETARLIVTLAELVKLRCADLVKLRSIVPSVRTFPERLQGLWLAISNKFRRHFWLPEPFGLAWPKISQHDPPALLASFIKSADYKLDLPLQALIERIHNPEIADLLRKLPLAGKEGLRAPAMTDAELASLSLRAVAQQILDYQAAFVGEADAGWFNLGREPRIGFKHLRNILADDKRTDPTTLREALELLESTPCELPDPLAYYKRPNRFWDERNVHVDIVNKAEWVICEACERRTPAREDRLQDEKGCLQPVGTRTYICAFCRHVHVGTVCWGTGVEGQEFCLNCETSLGTDFQCPTCSFPRGWKITRCSLCGNSQPTYLPPLWPWDADEPFRLDCVECERSSVDPGLTD